MPPQAQLQQGFPEPRPPEIPKFEVPLFPSRRLRHLNRKHHRPEPVVIAPPQPVEAEPAPLRNLIAPIQKTASIRPACAGRGTQTPLHGSTVR